MYPGISLIAPPNLTVLRNPNILENNYVVWLIQDTQFAAQSQKLVNEKTLSQSIPINNCMK